MICFWFCFLYVSDTSAIDHQKWPKFRKRFFDPLQQKLFCLKMAQYTRFSPQKGVLGQSIFRMPVNFFPLKSRKNFFALNAPIFTFLPPKHGPKKFEFPDALDLFRPRINIFHRTFEKKIFALKIA